MLKTRIVLRRHSLPLALLLLAALSGCASLQSSDNVLGIVTPYRIEIVQGNVVTQEQMARIHPGLVRSQVRDVMGSPLLADIFHSDRWDYVFTIRRQGTEPQQRVITLRFDGETLKSIDAPELPSEREFVASIDTFKSKRDAGTLALTEEQRKDLPRLAKPEAPAADAASAPAPTRSYPPLEPSS